MLEICTIEDTNLYCDTSLILDLALILLGLSLGMSYDLFMAHFDFESTLELTRLILP